MSPSVTGDQPYRNSPSVWLGVKERWNALSHRFYKKILRLFIVFSCTLVFTGCADKSLEIVRPAPERLQCAAEPVVPDGPITDRVTADFIVAQRAAYLDCSNALAWIKDWFAGLPD